MYSTFALSKTEEKKEILKTVIKTVLEVISDSVNKISWKSSLGSLAFEKKMVHGLTPMMQTSR